MLWGVLLVHDVVGLMISYRGALHLPDEIALPAVSGVSPIFTPLIGTSYSPCPMHSSMLICCRRCPANQRCGGTR